MEYQIGQTYDFNVQGLKESPDGQLFIYLDDGAIFTYRVRPYDFQLEPNYQLPNTLKCDVYGMNIHDLPLLRQNKDALLEELYERNYNVFPRADFSILKVAKDGDAPYLLIQDEYGIPHRYYTENAQEYEVGGTIELCIKGIITRNGKSYIELIAPRERKRFTIDELTPYVAPAIEEHQADFGIEDLHTEFKTSIVFPANKNVADIDKQMSIIVKEIASFMNAEGGRMYIGVKDDGKSISGIENDYPHLQDSEYDKFSYDITGKTEQQKQDVYANKIRNSISVISSIAGSLITISFQIIKGHTICIVDIKPSSKPMFVNGILYQRQGASCRPLRGDDISYFVLSKLNGEAITKFLGSYGNDVDVPEDDEAVIEETPAATNAIPNIPTLSVEDDDRDHRVWKNLSFYSDGGYSEGKTKYPNKAQVLHNITIEKYQKKEHQVLLMQYSDGCLNAVECEKKPFNDKGWGVNGSYLATDSNVQFERVWCADLHDFVAVYCEKDGETYVRVVNVSDIGVHGSLHLHGNQMAPGDCKVIGIYHIPASFHPYIVQLIKRQGAGYNVNGNKKQKSIQRLNEIVKSLQQEA